MKKKLILILLVSLLFSCSFVTKRKNDPYDIENAKKVSTSFYSSLLKQDYNGAVAEFADIAIKNQTKDSLITYLKNVQTILGPLQSYNYLEGSSFVIEGTKQKGEYEVKYSAQYTRDNALEKFLMIQQKGIIKILAYRITSDSLDIKMKDLNTNAIY